MIQTKDIQGIVERLQMEATIQRDLMSEYESEDAVEVPLLLEQAAELVEECLELRQWKAGAVKEHPGRAWLK